MGSVTVTHRTRLLKDMAFFLTLYGVCNHVCILYQVAIFIEERLSQQMISKKQPHIFTTIPSD